MAIRDRIARLRAPRNTPRPSSPSIKRAEPWWVKVLTDFGRPIVAVIVMVMCAPGEHHLGVLAGWDGRLAWGMAAVLAAYAGIAAVVATRRPKRAPGKRSAVAGAILSLAAAMAAQPVSHAFVTGWLSATPRSPLWLVIIVSCVPPLVLGHLLHLASTPARATEDAPRDIVVTRVPARGTEDAPAFRPTSRPVIPPAPRTLPMLTKCGTRPMARDADDAQRAVLQRARAAADELGLLTTQEVALQLGVTPSTVRNWVSRGHLTVVGRNTRGHSLFHPSHLAAAASQN